MYDGTGVITIKKYHLNNMLLHQSVIWFFGKNPINTASFDIFCVSWLANLHEMSFIILTLTNKRKEK